MRASEHLKSQIPGLHHEGFSVKEICHQLDVKKSLVYQVLNRFGVVSSIHSYSCMVGRPCSFSHANLTFLSALLDHQKSLYLDELQDELLLKRNVHATLSTLHRALQQLGISRKTISAHAYERNELLWAMYMKRIGDEAPDARMLMFVDEAAKDERTVSRRYGRSTKGVRCVVQRQFVRGVRYSIIPVISHMTLLMDLLMVNIFLKFVKDHIVTPLLFLVSLIANVAHSYRCRSQTLILVLAVCLSWIIAPSIMVNESVNWSKTKIVSVTCTS